MIICVYFAFVNVLCGILKCYLCIVTVQLVFCVVRDQSEILRCAFVPEYNDIFLCGYKRDF